jgi:hypothetical protein
LRRPDGIRPELSSSQRTHAGTARGP